MNTKHQVRNSINIVTISGELNIEATQPFKKACLERLQNQKVVFNMKEAQFVGSTGLQSFIETIRELKNSNGNSFKVADLKPEFKRILQNVVGLDLEIYDNTDGALKSFVAASSVSDSTQD